MIRNTILILVVALVAAACSSGSSEPSHDNPERAVVAWFEAIDGGDVESASQSVHPGSLAIILSIENDLDEATTASYLADGVPLAVQAGYWASFGEGFSDFASRPISSLTVGESTVFTAEGNDFARVPISGGASSESIVYTRMQDDGSWQVDLIATLGDGFGTLLSAMYQGLSETEEGDAITAAFADVVAPGIWAAIADGAYGDEFSRVGLALVGLIDA
ncbi:MAG: hypothetical protein ACR2N2_05370 [Acidimicrobiia bacterium]